MGRQCAVYYAVYCKNLLKLKAKLNLETCQLIKRVFLKFSFFSTPKSGAGQISNNEVESICCQYQNVFYKIYFFTAIHKII